MNILPEGANSNAYCTVSVVATGPDALITFLGDGPSDYADPVFVAKSGETNEVVILIGKTYTISSEWPFDVVGASDPETEIWQMRSAEHQTHVRRPVTISSSEGNPFTMSVLPTNLGGTFVWNQPDCGCTLTGSGDTFSWNCPITCTCCGTYADGWYSYEGYLLSAVGCLCGCWSDGTGPEWTDAPGPLQPSVSATFSKNAVIFEDAYENLPGQWVGRRSTRTRLNIVANGGPDGAVLSIESTNLVKLVSISGPNLPLSPVNVPAETQVSYSIVYEGLEASDDADDIVVRALIQDNDAENAFTNECSMTSVRLELQAVYEAPENPCTNRHVYGVGEKVRFRHYPDTLCVALSADKGDCGDVFTYYDQFDASINEEDKHRIYVCPIAACYVPNPTIAYAEATYSPVISLVEPNEVITPVATWMGCHALGEAGQSTLVTTNYIGPMTASFQGIMVAEIPCNETNAPSGYFATTNFTGFLTHCDDAGAGYARRVQGGNRWTIDEAGGGLYRSWEPGHLQWNMPIGWIRLTSDIDWKKDYTLGEYASNNVSSSCFLLIGGRSNLYTQTFRIEEDGTARIDKYGHWLSRSRYCHIILDGDTKQWTHPIW